MVAEVVMNSIISFFEYDFFVRALIALILLAPMTAMMGVQVVNGRKAFFVDAVSHTSFAGVAMGIILGVSPYITMPVVAVIIACLIIYFDKKSKLSGDSVVGVLFSGIVAFGLAIVSRNPSVRRDVNRFLFGDILAITNGEIIFLAVILLVLILFQIFAFNSLLAIGLNATLAKAHEMKVKRFQYLQAILLALVIIFSVWWVGVFLVTGLLIIPAATARNLAKTARAMFYHSIVISFLSSVIGLFISIPLQMATGPTIILVALAFFFLSILIAKMQR